MGRSRAVIRLSLLSVFALALFPGSTKFPQSTKQAFADDGFTLPMVATNCQRMPTAFPFEGGDCVPAEGAVIVVTTEDGKLIGTCVAKTEGGSESKIAACSVVVPFGLTVIVTEDVTAISPDHAPQNNAQRWPIPDGPPQGEFGGPIFINLPVAGSGTPTATPTATPQSTYSACTAPPYPTPALDPTLNLSGYLALYYDGAGFVEWIDVAGSLSGTLYWTSPDDERPREFKSETVSFTGVLSDDRLALTFEQGFGFNTTISGQLSDGTLTLYFPQDSGAPWAAVMHPGTLAEYQQAIRSLELEAAQAQECAQEVGATATAVAAQQDAVAVANASVDRALSDLADATSRLEDATDFSDTMSEYADDLSTMQDDDNEMRSDAAVEPFDCYQLSVVEYDLSVIEYDMTVIEYDRDTLLSYDIETVNGYISDVEQAMRDVQSAFDWLQTADVANTTSSPSPAYTQDDIAQDVTAAQQQIDASQATIDTAQEQASGYEQSASQVLQDASDYVAGLACSD
jgi:hypothetical protein